MRKLRSILGILLILLSIVGLFLWEWKGRETLMTDEVLVAKEEIRKGAIVDSGMFITKGVPRENLLPGALTPGAVRSIQGKAASQFIAENGQVVADYFRADEFSLGQDESVFVIDPGWIGMRSSALRRGDIVDIYGSGGLGLLGTFRIAYVKDDADREVRNVAADTGVNVEAGKQGDRGILERPDGSAVIDHIEIISTFQEYENLVNSIGGGDETTPAALIIVQRGDQIGS